MSNEDSVDDLRWAMGEAVEEMRAATEELLRESKHMNAEVEAERAALRADRSRAMGDYAELARDGEAGRARQELQRRLDRDDTTWRRVMSGEDTHWSAEDVRAETVSAARTEVDAIERSEPTLAATYRKHAVLRRGDQVGDWD